MSVPGGQLIARFFEEVWNKGRRELIEEFVAPECIIHDGETTTTGPEGFKPFYDGMRVTFSDIRVTPHESVNEGELACLRWSVVMRHTGEGLDLPPKGQEVKTTGISMIRIRNGKFVEAWQNWDMLGVLEQIRQAGPAMTYIGKR